MPPIQQPDAMHGVQHHLHSLVKAWLLAIVNRGVLEDQTHAMMPHICAHIDGEQGKRHTHDYWHEYEVKGGDLQQTAPGRGLYGLLHTE